MRWKLAIVALVLAVAQSAHAQSVNSDWSLGGGVGIGRHATGFSGTLGDPEYSGSSMPPTLRDYRSVPGHPRGTPVGPGYAPGYLPPATGTPFEYYTPPSRR